MRFSKKNVFLKTVAVLACFGIICLSFPGAVQAAERKASKPDFRTFVKRDMHLPYFFSPIFSPIFIPVEIPDQEITNKNSNSSGKFNLLGNSTSKKKPTGKGGE